MASGGRHALWGMIGGVDVGREEGGAMPPSFRLAIMPERLWKLCPHSRKRAVSTAISTRAMLDRVMGRSTSNRGPNRSAPHSVRPERSRRALLSGAKGLRPRLSSALRLRSGRTGRGMFSPHPGGPFLKPIGPGGPPTHGPPGPAGAPALRAAGCWCRSAGALRRCPPRRSCCRPGSGRRSPAAGRR